MTYLGIIFLIIVLIVILCSDDNNNDKGGKGSTSKHINIDDIIMFDCMNKGKTR